MDKGVRCILVNNQLDMEINSSSSKLMLHVLSALSELERDLISIKTKEASLKARGIKLGKPMGTLPRIKVR